MFITLRSGFRGWYSRIDVHGGELLFKRLSTGHCVETGHLVARSDGHDASHVVAETGRRSGTGIVEVFTWDEYHVMAPEEHDVWACNW